jgi:putative ABC transport system permease protein
MKEGRYFSEEFGTDTSGIIINEAAVKLMGWNNPLGKIFDTGSGPLSVIGVVKDFHYESLHYDIRPGALMLLGDHTSMSERYISVRITPGNTAEKLEYIIETWGKYSNGIPLEYSFLDEDFNRLYNNEEQTGRIFLIFSILAIFIACLGLFGMTSFIAELKTKEIGIRKVLGSSVASIVLLLSKEFTRWVIIANLVAWPVSYLLMKNWLEDFAYRIGIEWWFFILSGGTVLLISIITVMHIALKAANANPVNSLRSE